MFLHVLLVFYRQVPFRVLITLTAMVSNLLFSHKSVVTIMYEQNIICSITHLDGNSAVVYRSHSGMGSRPIKTEEKCIEWFTCRI